MFHEYFLFHLFDFISRTAGSHPTPCFILTFCLLSSFSRREVDPELADRGDKVAVDLAKT